MRISDWSSDVCSSDLPNVAYWNLFCLAQALLPLIGDQEVAVAALQSYKTVFPEAYEARMRAKLGLPEAAADDRALIEGDRKSVVEGKSVSVRVDLGGRRILKKKNKSTNSKSET